MISPTASHLPTGGGFTERTFLLAVSRLGASSWFGRTYLEALAEWTLQLDGVLGLSIDLNSGLFGETEAVFDWGEKRLSGQPDIASRAGIAANGRASGTLRLRLQPGQTGIENPVKLAGFLAQQIALMMRSAELASANRTLAADLVTLTEELATRKALDRARGMLAERRAITYDKAEELLRQSAARNGRPLREIANAIAATHGGSFGSLLRQTA